MKSEPVIVFDFETTGGAPVHGDRPIEVGAVLIENDMIVDRFQELMNPGFTITSFIESITGISNELVAQARPCEMVMADFIQFIGTTPLVAHNAAFDMRFLDSEMQILQAHRENSFACSMLISRRVFQHSPDHKLRTLVDYCGIYSNNIFHRALEDAEKTGHLWIAMRDTIKERYGVDEISFEQMQGVATIEKKRVDRYFSNIAMMQTQQSLVSNNL